MKIFNRILANFSIKNNIQKVRFFIIIYMQLETNQLLENKKTQWPIYSISNQLITQLFGYKITNNLKHFSFRKAMHFSKTRQSFLWYYNAFLKEEITSLFKTVMRFLKKWQPCFLKQQFAFLRRDNPWVVLKHVIETTERS